MNGLLVLFGLISFGFNCGTKTHSDIQIQDKTYLALGDSYTIGESVSPDDSFPNQLSSKLNYAGFRVKRPKIIAQTGWTSAELISSLERAHIAQKFDIVTLLIGVNNQYRQESVETYREEFVYLLGKAIGHAGNGKSSVFVLSIPDWSVTPFGQHENPKAISKQIDEFNAVNKQESLRASVHYIDITPSSRLAAGDRSLIAADGLHPSAKMYAHWVKQLIPLVVNELN